MRKKVVSSLLAMAMLVSVLSATLASAHAIQIEPRYTGISSLSSTLTISSSGAAKCNGSVEVYGGYTVNLTVELKQDGDSIKTWTSSGSGTVSAGGTYYVMSGHNYVVTTTVDVYKGGTLVESPSKDSPESSY